MDEGHGCMEGYRCMQMCVVVLDRKFYHNLAGWTNDEAELTICATKEISHALIATN